MSNDNKGKKGHADPHAPHPPKEKHDPNHEGHHPGQNRAQEAIENIALLGAGGGISAMLMWALGKLKDSIPGLLFSTLQKQAEAWIKREEEQDAFATSIFSHLLARGEFPWYSRWLTVPLQWRDVVSGQPTERYMSSLDKYRLEIEAFGQYLDDDNPVYGEHNTVLLMQKITDMIGSEKITTDQARALINELKKLEAQYSDWQVQLETRGLIWMDQREALSDAGRDQVVRGLASSRTASRTERTVESVVEGIEGARESVRRLGSYRIFGGGNPAPPRPNRTVRRMPARRRSWWDDFWNLF